MGEAGNDGPKYLLSRLTEAKHAIECARMQFNEATDPNAIDEIIYRWIAEEKRFQTLIRTAREANITIEGLRWYWHQTDPYAPANF